MSEIRISRSVLMIAGLATVALATAGGFWLGDRRGNAAGPEKAPTTAPKPAQAETRVPLYYQDPDGKPDYSATPKKTANGRDYAPVYQDGGPAAPIPAASNQAPPATGRVLYYRNPMGLADTSPVPKKDSMGMAYIPVYEGENVDSGIVQVSPGRMQMLGVRTAPVETRQGIGRILRATGIVQIDERRQAVVSTKASGWIEQLNISAVGDRVARGQPLFELYSPDIIAAEHEYLIAAQLPGAHADAGHGNPTALADATLQRLRTLDVPETEITRLMRTGEVTRRIVVAAPANGTVLEKQAVEGMHVDPGMPLYKIADLSSVWLIVDVQEQDLGALRVGEPAHASFVAFPGRIFEGRVDFIYPSVTPDTRTGKVRIVLHNPDLVLKTAMYAAVDLDVPAPSAGQILVVPDSAVIDSGARQVVLVERGEGRFEPRPVRLGERGTGYVQILEGVKEGERVVTGANFLIDAESNLRAALSTFSGAQTPTGAPTTQSPGAKP